MFINPTAMHQAYKFQSQLTQYLENPSDSNNCLDGKLPSYLAKIASALLPFLAHLHKK